MKLEHAIEPDVTATVTDSRGAAEPQASDTGREPVSKAADGDDLPAHMVTAALVSLLALPVPEQLPSQETAMNGSGSPPQERAVEGMPEPAPPGTEATGMEQGIVLQNRPSAPSVPGYPASLPQAGDLPLPTDPVAGTAHDFQEGGRRRISESPATQQADTVPMQSSAVQQEINPQIRVSPSGGAQPQPSDKESAEKPLDAGSVETFVSKAKVVSPSAAEVDPGSETSEAPAGGRVSADAVAASFSRPAEALQQEAAQAAAKPFSRSRERGNHPVTRGEDQLAGRNAETEPLDKPDSLPSDLPPVKMEKLPQGTPLQDAIPRGENSGPGLAKEKGWGNILNFSLGQAAKNPEAADPAWPQAQAKLDPAGAELRESILSQVKDGVASYAAKGNGQITIKLNPAELGELKINVHLKDQQVKIEVTAENRLVKDILMGHLDTLKETLSKQHLTMEKFNVSTGDGYGFSQTFREERRPASPWTFSPFAGMDSSPAEGEERSMHWAGRKDALVDLRL